MTKTHDALHLIETVVEHECARGSARLREEVTAAVKEAISRHSECLANPPAATTLTSADAEAWWIEARRILGQKVEMAERGVATRDAQLAFQKQELARAEDALRKAKLVRDFRMLQLEECDKDGIHQGCYLQAFKL